MKLVLLWTDVLLWLLVIAIVAYFAGVRKNPLARATWKQVFDSGPAVASAVILSIALLLTLLDSIHYRVLLPSKNNAAEKIAVAYSPTVYSLLDKLLEPMVAGQEKSYSAPLAITALSKQTLQVDGKTIRNYPRLKFGGAHLKHVEDKTFDLALRALRGVILGSFVFGMLVLVCKSAIALYKQSAAPSANLSDALTLPFTSSQRWGVITLGFVCALGGVAWQWSLGYHVLGTDKVGVDVLYIALKSMRTAVVLGLLTTLVTLPIGVFAGLAAGYFKGWVDDVIQYIYTTLNSIPSVLLIAAAVLMLQVWIEANPQSFPTASERGDVRLFFLCVILGVTSWTGLARLLRGEVLKLRELEYVQAARAFGASHTQLLVRHLLPNVMHIILISLVMDFSGLVLAEAVLSYVGVGVDPNTISYGTMINAARLELSREPIVWWTLAAAFAFMLVLVLAANLFADAVREAFDPRAHQLKKSLIQV
jgi:peptide/nickel transport system permease protein